MTDHYVVPIRRTSPLFLDVDQHRHQVGQALEMPVQIAARVAVVHDRTVKVERIRKQIVTLGKNLVSMALTIVGETVEAIEALRTEKKTRILREIGTGTALETDMVTGRKRGATVTEIANAIVTGTGIAIVEMTRIVIGKTGKIERRLVAMVFRI